MAHIHRRGRAGEGRSWEDAGDLASMIDEFVGKDLINSRSFRRIVIQDFCYEVPGCISDRNVFGERISVHSDSLIGSLDIRSFKRWLSNDQGINNDTERPYVDLV